MKDKKRTISLVAKVIGGVAFLFVFVLNIMLFVRKDSNRSNLSVETLKAYAEDDGEGSGGGENTGGDSWGKTLGDFFDVTCGETRIEKKTYEYRNSNGQIVGTFVYEGGELKSSSGVAQGTLTITTTYTTQGGHKATGWNCVPGSWYETCTPCANPCAGC